MTTKKMVYKSIDGREFSNPDNCKEYEDALKTVLGAELISTFRIVTEKTLFNEQCSSSDDWYYATIKVTDDNYDKLRMFADLSGSTLEAGYKGIDGKRCHFTKDCIGKTVMFCIGDYYNDTTVSLMDYCGTVNEWYAYMTNAMLKALES